MVVWKKKICLKEVRKEQISRLGEGGGRPGNVPRLLPQTERDQRINTNGRFVRGKANRLVQGTTIRGIKENGEKIFDGLYNDTLHARIFENNGPWHTSPMLEKSRGLRIARKAGDFPIPTIPRRGKRD